MTYTILSAQWGNEDKSSAVITTKEAAAVAVSPVDTPEEWYAFLEWSSKNYVSDLAAPVSSPPKITLGDIETRLTNLEKSAFKTG